MYGLELIMLMKKDGRRIDRVHGSHYIMKKGSKTEVIPLHKKDLPVGLEKSIRKRIGL